MGLLHSRFEVDARPAGFNVGEDCTPSLVARAGGGEGSSRGTLDQVFEIPPSLWVAGEIQACFGEGEIGDGDLASQERANAEPGGNFGSAQQGLGAEGCIL